MRCKGRTDSLPCNDQVDAQPFVPNASMQAQQQQQQRGRSSSQGPPQYRSFSQVHKMPF